MSSQYYPLMPRRLFLILLAAFGGAILVTITAVLALRTENRKEKSILWNIPQEGTIAVFSNISPHERKLLNALLPSPLPPIPTDLTSAVLLRQNENFQWIPFANFEHGSGMKSPLARVPLIREMNNILEESTSWMVLTETSSPKENTLFPHGVVIAKTGGKIYFALPKPSNLPSLSPLPVLVSYLPKTATIASFASPRETFPYLLSFLPHATQDTVLSLVRTAMHKNFGRSIAIPADFDPLLDKALVVEFAGTGHALSFLSHITAEVSSLQTALPQLHEAFSTSLPAGHRVQRQLSVLWSADYMEEDPKTSKTKTERTDGWETTATEGAFAALFSAHRNNMAFLSNVSTVLERAKAGLGTEIELPQTQGLPPLFLAGGYMPNTSALTLLRMLGANVPFEEIIANIEKAQYTGFRWSLAQRKNMLYGAMEL